jgi:Flp pilus assembly protein TadD
MARQPTAATTHHALGLWLVRASRSQEAMEELKKAANLAPESAHFSFVYAVALASAGDRTKALEILRNSLDHHAYDRESLYAAAGYERDLGHVEAALGYATRLAELEPDDPNVLHFLSQIRN